MTRVGGGMKYRCLIETFIDVEADSEEDAQRKAAEKLCAELRDNPSQIIAWVDNDA